MYRIISVFTLLCLSFVVGTIYRLNATEYSRMPALYGLDDYEVCMEDPKAVYCIVKLDLYAEPSNSLMHTIREYSMDVNRHYNHTNVDRGVCVRTSCRQFLGSKELNTDRYLDQVIEQCMNKTFQRQYGLNTRLAIKFNCDRSEEVEEITLTDWSFLIVAVMLVLAVIGATVYDINLKKHNNKDRGNQCILSFSIDENFNDLYSHEDERAKNLSGLHGTRSVLNILTISVHVAYIYAGGFQRNPHNVEKSYENVIGYLFYNGLVIVQIFFFISGFLLAINMKIESETENLTWRKIVDFMFKRFLRLTPGLGMLIWFTSTWLRHLGSGPLWKLYITNSVVADCHKYWWSHLLFINNYVPDNKKCAIQTWHIAADTQLFLLALVVLMATMKGGRRSIMMALLLLGTLAPAVHVWLANLDAMALVTPELFRSAISDSLFLVHMTGHNNIQNYVVGIAAGMFYDNYQRKGKHIALTKHFSNYKWFYATCHLLTIPAYAYFFYLCHVFYEEETPLLTRVLFAANQRLIMAAFTTWLILGFAFQAPGILRKAAESHIWVVPSRLSYSVYLVHFNIVHVLIGSKQYTSDIGTFTLIIAYFGVLFLSYILALVFYLVVEAPFNGIAKVITQSQPPTKNENTTKHVNGKTLKDE